MTKRRNEELEADVVVVGAGACGLSAALTVGSGGAKVIIFEKRGNVGGLSNFVEGIFAVGSKLQEKMKLNYTLEDRFKVHMEACNWEPDARLVRTFMEKTADTIDWLMKLGCKFSGVYNQYPGSPFVWHMLEGRGLKGLIEPLFKRAQEEKNIRIFLETPVKKIIKENGKISGVIAEDKNGNVINVKCKAVVIATGGYGDNSEWVEKFLESGKYLKPVIKADQTGDGIKMAWEVGAAAMGLGRMQAIPCIPNEFIGSLLSVIALQPNLWVNERGERFCDESIVWRFPIVTNALLRQPHACAYSIFDQDMVAFIREHGLQYWVLEYFDPLTRANEIDAELKRGVKENKVFEAASIKELAKKINVNSVTLEDTVNAYNECCDKNYDFLFFKDRRYLHPIRKPKFYAVKISPHIIITEGGIRVNHKMEVLDDQLNAIPGLYAGGCSVEGPVGHTYPLISTGVSASFAVNSGRIAGENILKFLGK